MNITKKSVDSAKKVAGLYHPKTIKAHGWVWRIALLIGTLTVINCGLMMWWSHEPAQFDPNDAATKYLSEGEAPVTGSAFVGTNIEILDKLLHKTGGFITNDKTPPGIFMDNITSWEKGVVELMRQTTLVLANDFSRSQSQSSQLQMLTNANGEMNINWDNWIMPSAESKYEAARQNLIKYGQEIADGNSNNANFYARADNLNAYLALISKQLGSMTQTLAASVGDTLVQDVSDPSQAKNTQAIHNKTSWWKIDNNFFRARGYAWALLQELRAIRIDFKDVLQKKAALTSLDQIINELEKTQKTIWSPMIMNGRGFGFSANHSLVMASYLSRANAALIELQDLLRNG